MAGDVDAIEDILTRDASGIDEPSGGEIPLGLAAMGGHTPAIVVLLERGARVNATNSDGWCPLHSACLCHPDQSAETVALLLAHGADLHARTTRDRYTALHVAAFNGHLGASKLLVHRGAPSDATDASGDTPRAKALERSLACACMNITEPERQWGALLAFFDKIAPMDDAARAAFVRRSWRLLVSSRLHDALEDVDELVRLCVCFGAEDADAPDHDGATALHAAALGGHTDALPVLLSLRPAPALVVDVSDRTVEDGRTPQPPPPTPPPPIEARTNLGETPLHFAAREGRLEAVEMLVASGADVDATTKFGATALDLARRCQERDWEAVAAVLVARAGRHPAPEDRSS